MVEPTPGGAVVTSEPSPSTTADADVAGASVTIAPSPEPGRLPRTGGGFGPLLGLATLVLVVGLLLRRVRSGDRPAS